jgi:hypothetical protein
MEEEGDEREEGNNIWGGISECGGVTGGVKVIREVYAGPCRVQQGLAFRLHPPLSCSRK